MPATYFNAEPCFDPQSPVPAFGTPISITTLSARIIGMDHSAAPVTVGQTTKGLSDWIISITSGSVTSVAGRAGAVTLTHGDLTDWSSATSGFLTTSGNGSALTGITWSQISGIPAIGSQSQTFTSSGTWTPPAGAKFHQLLIWGGGGSGGGGVGIAAGGSGSGGGGGGGGAFFDSGLIPAGALSGSATITIGAQPGMSPPGAAGSQGASVTFSISGMAPITVYGGGGGSPGASGVGSGGGGGAGLATAGGNASGATGGIAGTIGGVAGGSATTGSSNVSPMAGSGGGGSSSAGVSNRAGLTTGGGSTGGASGGGCGSGTPVSGAQGFPANIYTPISGGAANGSPGATGFSAMGAGGGGGSGGGGNSGTNAVGGDGGSGSDGGGGGGGGTAAGTGATGGQGGRGGAPKLTVISYF